MTRQVRTKDFDKALSRHRNFMGDYDLSFNPRYPPDDPIVRRGLEEQLIEDHGLESEGGTLKNKIHGISPDNPNYDDYVDAGKKHLGDNDACSPFR